jgi:mRNA interferase RelE/StbE
VPCSVQIKASALREIEKLPATDRRRVVEAIDGLRQNPRAGTQLKGEHTGLRRIRVEAFRIIYEVQDAALVVLALRLGHRRDVYR